MSTTAFGTIDIIPQNFEKVQAGLSTNRQFPYNLIQTPEDLSLVTQVQQLFDLGFNVFPQPLGKKAGLPWQKLQYTRLHRDHARYGLPALFNSRCNVAIMCGKTSDNLFIIDCETLEAFNHHLLQMRQRQIPLWAVKTARGGHIYLRCKEGEVANIDSGVVPNTEIKGCRRYVLAPPSVHPNGDVYQWIAQEGHTPPSIKLEAIDWLQDNSGTKISLRLDQPKRKNTDNSTMPTKNRQPYYPLSKATQDYLTNGHLLSEGSRNNRLFSAACDLAGNNHSYEDTYQQLVPIAQNSGLTEHEVKRTIDSAFSQHRTPAKPQQTQKTARREDWKQAFCYAQSQKWETRCGNTDQTVFIALAERAKVSINEHGVFRASIREIAQIARVSTKTAQKALKRLQITSPPLIFKVGSDKTSDASLWRFSNHILTTIESKSNTLESPPHWQSNSVVLSNSDILERGALGRVGWLLYQFLLSSDCALMPKRIAEGSGLKLHQVSYYLPRLRDCGLVERLPDGWKAMQVTSDVLLRDVPLKAGTLGKGEARRLAFASERALDAGRRLLAAQFKWDRRNQGASHSHEEMFTVASQDSVLQLVQDKLENNCFETDFQVIVQQQPETIGADAAVVPLQSSAMGEPLCEVESARIAVQLWECPNCGQLLFSDSPPDMCDFCGDFTTWKKRSDEVSPDDADEVDLDDPLLRLAFELGAVLRVE
jgi:hypothetical protein